MAEHRDMCRRVLETMGAFRSPWLRAAFDAVERTDFVPHRIWIPGVNSEGLYPLIDREADEDAWLAAVWDPHQSVITQLDDGATDAAGPAKGDFTSSVSAPDIVYEKLNQLELRPQHRVLEIGLGYGYHTALLCERGSDVTSIEVDPALLEAGRARLKQAGYTARAVCGDGLDGFVSAAPYDRIISTASVRAIPGAWRHQAADGAIILTPFSTAYAAGGLLKLQALDGMVTGQFVGSANYMPVRGHRIRHLLNPPDTYEHASSPIDPAQILDRTWAQDYAIGLHVPDIHHTHREYEGERQVQFWDTVGTSVTIVAYTGWAEDTAVTCWGPRNLWAEVIAAYTRWRTAGQPHFTRYGLTINDTGSILWLDAPDHEIS